MGENGAHHYGVLSPTIPAPTILMRRQKRRTDQSLPRENFLCNDRRITACHGPQVVSSQQLRLLMEVCRRAAKITSLTFTKKTITEVKCQGHTCPLKRAKRQPKPLKRLFSIHARQACGTRPSVAMTPSLGRTRLCHGPSSH